MTPPPASGRVLKFRAWDGKKMCFPSVYEFGINGINGLPSIAFQLPDGGYCTSANIMQFTGLLDRHGTEIYEGNILKLDGGAKPEKIIVEWEQPAARWSCRVPWLSEKENNLVPLEAYVDMKFCQVEILGNIYEHPELLHA